MFRGGGDGAITGADAAGPGIVAGMTDILPQYPLEKDERLSRCMLWRLQRTFFAAQGIEAWRQGIVPHYITSNAFIADAYARVVAAYLGERLALLKDAGQPVHILELGAGSGKFASLFLKRLSALTRRMGPAAPAWKLVVTDLADRNVAFWRDHPGLRPFVERGVLDFARFDVENDREITLVESGETIGPRTLVNGLVVLGNYFFDGIPIDVFQIEGGNLLEGTVTVSSSQQEPDLDDPAVLGRVSLAFTHKPTVAEGYYDDPAFNKILQTYQERLGNTSVHFPIAGLRICKLLREWSGGHMLMLTGDKGYIRDEDLLDKSEPGLAIHGSFSMSVDYHAIGAYFRGAGGQVFEPRHRHDSLLSVGFLLGAHPDEHRATRDAFADAIGEFGPDEFFGVAQMYEKVPEGATVSQLLSLIHLGRSDPRLLGKCIPALNELVGSASSREKLEIYQAIEQAWFLYFHLGDDDDIPFEFGRLLYRMDYYPEALQYFSRSIELYGENPHTRFNMSLCYFYLHQRDEALNCVAKTLALNPNHQGAKGLRIEIQAWTR